MPWSGEIVPIRVAEAPTLPRRRYSPSPRQRPRVASRQRLRKTQRTRLPSPKHCGSWCRRMRRRSMAITMCHQVPNSQPATVVARSSRLLLSHKARIRHHQYRNGRSLVVRPMQSHRLLRRPKQHRCRPSSLRLRILHPPLRPLRQRKAGHVQHVRCTTRQNASAVTRAGPRNPVHLRRPSRLNLSRRVAGAAQYVRLTTRRPT